MFDKRSKSVLISEGNIFTKRSESTLMHSTCVALFTIGTKQSPPWLVSEVVGKFSTHYVLVAAQSVFLFVACY